MARDNTKVFINLAVYSKVVLESWSNMVTRANAPSVLITLDMKRRAKLFAENVVQETYNRFSYDAETRKQKIYLGKLGEEALLSFLSQNNISCEIDYKIYPGTSSIDETDFIVYKNHKRVTIDVKAGSQPFHKRLLVVKSYFDNIHQSDYYVGLNFYNNESMAIIYGYATKKDIESAPVKTWDKVNPLDDYTLLYDELKSIDGLIEILK